MNRLPTIQTKQPKKLVFGETKTQLESDKVF